MTEYQVAETAGKPLPTECLGFDGREYVVIADDDPQIGEGMALMLDRPGRTAMISTASPTTKMGSSGRR